MRVRVRRERGRERERNGKERDMKMARERKEERHYFCSSMQTDTYKLKSYEDDDACLLPYI